MVSVHELQDQVLGPDQFTSPTSEGGDDNAAAARPSWIQRHFFVVFLAGSLIFHLCLVTIVSFFDLRWVAPWMSFKELPVELINEEQIQKEEKKAGAADAKGQPREQPSASIKKDAQTTPQTTPQIKPPDAQAEKPAQPPQEQQRPAEKPSENKQSENKQPENKSGESKPNETKSTEAKPSEAKPAENKPEDKKTERNTATHRQPQTAANKQQEAQQKELPQKEVAKQAAQKPEVPQIPKPVETQQPAAPINPQQAQEHRLPQQQQTVPSTAQPPLQAAQYPSPAPSRMPTFLYQPSDRLSLAIPAPLPTNDADAEPVSYKVIVFGMLERAKNYPPGARERHAMGHVVIAFSIDDTGQPQKISMLESSGESDLDAEALAMISRAAPFPVPPAGAQRDFAVNIGFGGRVN